jgi:hypothetical protein
MRHNKLSLGGNMQLKKQPPLKPQSVKLSGYLVRDAELRARQFSRSKAGQIEFWAKIGKIAEENPDISFDVIRQILISKEEMLSNQTEPFKFSSKDSSTNAEKKPKS